ncbi:hypothetical protein [Legionella erythra]|uniref:Uncharacterized protein n=1 Tax=Legionella erythra TaxID=448 RepID=A0A0W0TGP3_LEGER|nr:hypothetical protein [Legionella erythra]KTC94637.1 hypothetical protein Lery_2804 [Legionella erythra]
MQYDSLYQDKIGFFEKAAAKASKGKDLIQFADKYVGKAEYPFIARNYTLLQREFEQLFTSLEARKKNPKDLWLYCYYRAMLLATYHEHYGQKAKAEEYKNTAGKIITICERNREVKEREEESAVTHLKKETALESYDGAMLSTLW